jgi:hypothetical protein
MRFFLKEKDHFGHLELFPGPGKTSFPNLQPSGQTDGDRTMIFSDG